MKASDLEILLPKPPAPPPLVPMWGTVTQASPLRVQVDGDEAPLPITPTSVTGPLQVGSRVLCALMGRHLVIIGSTPAPVRAEARRATGSTTLAAGAWTTYPLDTVVSAGGGSWSQSKWTCPKAGTYLIIGSVRLADGAASRSVGVGVGTASVDGPSVLWGDMGGARSGRQVSRVMDLAVGDEVRIFLYSETQAFVTHDNGTTGPAGQALVIRELP